MATESSPRRVHYGIDADDSLAWVDDAWVVFARQNDAPELERESVVGRSLWDYVAGAGTCMIWQVLLARTRARGEEMVVPFRCDSPDLLRVMELRVVPTEDQQVHFTGELIREQPRRHLRILERRLTRVERAFPCCSFCKRVFAFGEWLEVDRAVARLGLLDVVQPPTLEQGVCEDCGLRLRREAAAGRPA